MTSTKICCLRTFAFAALSAAAIHFPAFADMKPVAIWNGEFGVKSQTRNGVTLSLTSSTLDERYAKLTSSFGPNLQPQRSGEYLSQSVIANISNVNLSLVPFDYHFVFAVGNTSVNTLCSLAVSDDSKLGFLQTKNTASFVGALSDDAISFADMHSFGMSLLPDNTETWAYGYLDGVPVCSGVGKTLETPSQGASRITIGTQGDQGQWGSNSKLRSGLISYIALFPYSATEHPSHEDFALWSLPGMTNAENVAANGVIVGGENTGVNLTNIVADAGGCRYDISGSTSIQALFVQEDSTLVFTSPDSALTVAGPVYIAPGRSLAVEIGENGPASGKLIETRKFADENQLSFPETLRVEYDDSAARYSLGYAGSAGANHGLTILFR